MYFAKHLPSPKLEDLTTKQKDEIISQCEWDIIKEIFKTLPKEGDLEVVNQPSYAHIFDFSLSEVLKSLEEIEDTEPAIP